MALINCPECNSQISDNSAFCIKCGYVMPLFYSLIDRIGSNSTSGMINITGNQKLLTKAQCTNCNAALEVDASLKEAICPFCNTSYVVEQAINNYNFNIENNVENNMNISNATINMSGDSYTAENYAKRGDLFLDQGEVEKALEYYDKALDIDVNNKRAIAGKERYMSTIDWYTLRVYNGNSLSKLVLCYKKLELRVPGHTFEYPLEKVENLICDGVILSFSFEGVQKKIKCTSTPRFFIEAVDEARNGIYKKYTQ